MNLVYLQNIILAMCVCTYFIVIRKREQIASLHILQQQQQQSDTKNLKSGNNKITQNPIFLKIKDLVHDLPWTHRV